MVSCNVTNSNDVLRLSRIWVCAFSILLGACVGPPALQRSVIGYDENENLITTDLVPVAGTLNKILSYLTLLGCCRN